MQIIFNRVSIEKTTKGRNSWETATVHYSFKGESRQQKIISFANPAVFDAIKQFNDGDVLEVDLVKDDNGYSKWAAVKLVGEPAKGEANTAPSRTVQKSTYETPEERAQKQVYIIRQSCLAQAVEFLTKAEAFTGDANDMDQVKTLASEFVDWVLEGGSTKEASQN